MKRIDDVTGVILAGGKSSRMGRDKAVLDVDGRTLFDRVLATMQQVFSRVIIAGDRPDLAREDVPCFSDRYPGSALGGLYTGLSAAVDHAGEPVTETVAEPAIESVTGAFDDNEDAAESIGADCSVGDGAGDSVVQGGEFEAGAQHRADDAGCAEEAASCEHIFVCACDIPFADPDIIRQLVALREGYDVVVPKVPLGHEPLFAVYGRECLPLIHGMLEHGEFQLFAFYPKVRVRYVQIEELPEHWLHSFSNVNTPEEYERVLTVVKASR